MVDRLIKAGANVKAANRYGVTPLYLACVNGSAPMIAKLLDAGADANSATTEGETALMTVARTGNVEAAKVLLAHGADVNSKEQWRQQTPLMWAVAESHPEMAQELIAHGADVNARQVEWHWERQVTKEPREKWMPLGGLTPLLLRRAAGLRGLRTGSGESRCGHQCRRSEQHHSHVARAHQRPLRFRGVSDRSGRRSEYRR